MNGDRGFSLLADLDQWARCHHTGTALMPGGGVQLTWTDDDTSAATDPAGTGCDGTDRAGTGASGPGGLGFDRWGRVYRSRPDQGRLSIHALDEPRRLGAEPPPEHLGRARQQGALHCPRGLAVDRQQRLCVTEAGDGHLYVVDLWSDRLLSRVPFRSPQHRRRRPVDVTTYRSGVAVLLQQPAGIALVAGRRRPRGAPVLRRPRCAGALEPIRIASGPDDRLLVLWRCPGGDDPTGLIAAPDGTVLVEVPGATDLELLADGVLVVARGPGRSWRRFQLEAEQRLELEPIAAPDHDGGAIALAPDGGLAGTTVDGGFGWAGGSRAVHVSRGTVLCYRLDSGAYQTSWGRIFLDTCRPSGTDVQVRCLSTDSDDVIDPIVARPADRGHRVLHRPDLTPPLPSAAFLEAAGDPQPLHRRSGGREQPWAQIAVDDRFETYEAPVTAPPGRYLWVELTLTGTARITPSVRAIRVERPGHRLLSQLPGAWSRQDADAGFSRRFLTPLDGLLHELDERAAQRDVLLTPSVAPQEVLNWLASFAGLVLDRRWPEAARRQLIGQAFGLFQRRGTAAALGQLLELYLGLRPALIEQWQLRGLGGALLGVDRDNAAVAVLGRTIRAGGSAAAEPAPGGELTSDAFRTSAHRFSVVVPADLSTEQLDVVHSILDAHRPAHTVVEVCELGFGMRVGRHLRLGLTSIVGPDAGWGPAIVGRIALGGDAVVGIPAEAARIGTDATVGAVRVG